MYWIDLAQDKGPVEGSCEHGNESSDSIKVGAFLSSCTTGGFSRRAQFPGVNFSYFYHIRVAPFLATLGSRKSGISQFIAHCSEAFVVSLSSSNRMLL
jgi:hypothetical protein